MYLTTCKITKFLRLRSFILILLLTCLCELSNAQSVSDTLRNDSLTTIITPNDSMPDSLQTQMSDELKSKVHYPAKDSVVFDVEHDKVFMYHNAIITYEDITLKANYIEIDWSSKTVLAKGGPDSAGVMNDTVEFSQGTETFKAQSIKYNFDTKKGKIVQIRTNQGDGYILGDTIRKTEFDNFYIKNGRYTTCDKPEPDFYIGSKKLKVIKNDKIVTGPAFLVLERVPTPLVIPFGFFPNKRGRSNGIVFPEIGESTNLGFYVKNGGYYFGIGDYVDVALTGDAYSYGSWAGHLYSNYANRYHYRGHIGIDYSHTKLGVTEIIPTQVNKDFHVSWSHSQDPKAHPSSSFSANVNFGSSSYYQNNLSTPVNFLSNTFVSSIAYSKTWPGKPYNLTVSGNQSQNITTHDISITLPDIGFGVNRFTPLKRKKAIGKEKWYEKIGLSYSLSAKNQIDTKDSLLFKKGVENQFRNGIAQSIPLSTSFKIFKYFNFTPSVNFTERWYFKTIEKTWDTASNIVIVDTVNGFKALHQYSASAGVNTRIYGMYQFRRGKLAAIRHVLTPTAAITYTPDYSESKYKYYKEVQSNSLGSKEEYSIFGNAIYGGPSSGKSGIISMGLDNNFEMKVRQKTDTSVNMKKMPLLESFAINSAYNYAVKQFQWSPISMTARTTLFNFMGLTGNLNYDIYAVDTAGYRIPVTEYKANHKLLRYTSSAMSINFPLNNQTFASKKTSDKGSKNTITNAYFAIPWNINIAYSINKSVAATSDVIQTLNFYGDISVTPKWKITIFSGYDFEQNDISYTSLGFTRDLHCWEMHLNWVPFGDQQNYFFQINVKSSMLQDLKYVKRKDIYD